MTEWIETWSGLRAKVVDTRDAAAADDEPAPVVVLLHGMHGTFDSLAPFAASLGVKARFVFPEGPVDLAAHGSKGRAWWGVDLARRNAELARGPRDLSNVTPRGLAAARSMVVALLDEVAARAPGAPIVLGGFSQGAMLTCDVALHDARPLAGLVLFAGTPLCMDAWRPRMESRRGLRVLQTHGTADAHLAFDAAERFKDELIAAGMDVTWVPFEGGHEVPLPALRALKRFLARVLA